MTREEAITRTEEVIKFLKDQGWDVFDQTSLDILALKMALTALRHQMWEEQLWHDAKTDPPKTPGLYYGKTDDTNSMYACQYRDGVWVLDMYPQQKMEIVQWADYTAFVQDNVESALRPVIREQVEKVWRGEWIWDTSGLYPKPVCSKCGEEPYRRSNHTSDLPNYCPKCGAPMTDEAVGMVLERMEALKNGKGD